MHLTNPENGTKSLPFDDCRRLIFTVSAFIYKIQKTISSFENKKSKFYLCQSWFSSKTDLLPHDSCRKPLSAGFKIKQKVFHGKFNN
jgi:hypothetical protein